MNEESGRLSERRNKEQLQKTEERIEKKHGQSQEGISWRAYMMMIWNFKEQDVVI
jgi:hypothetical protein